MRLLRFRLLMFSPPFLLNECQNAGFFLLKKKRWEGAKEKNKTTRKQKKTKRTSVSDKVLSEHL